MPGGHKASLPLPTDHYSPTPEGGNAYKVGDDHDPEGLFGVVRPLLKAGGALVTSRPVLVTTEPANSLTQLLRADVVFFMGGASPHGSVPYPQDANHPRRAVLMNWLGHGINLRSTLPPLLPRL